MRVWLTGFLQRCYFVRVPVLIYLLIGGLVLLRNTSFGSGLFYLPHDHDDAFRALCKIAIAVFLAAAACVLTFNLTSWCAKARFGVDMRIRSKWWTLAPFVTGHVSPLVFLWALLRTSADGGSTCDRPWLAILLGYLVVGVIVTAGEMLRNIFMAPRPGGHAPPPFLILPWEADPTAARTSRMSRIQDHDSAFTRWLRQGFDLLWAWPGSLIKPFLGPGYDGEDLEAAHIYASCVALASYVVYIVFASGHAMSLGLAWTNTENPIERLGWLAVRFLQLFGIDRLALPALAWLGLVLTLAAWTLSAVTFLLDRFRVPLIIPILAVVAVTGSVPESDHFYRSVPTAETWERKTPAQVIKDHGLEDGTVLVVSAPGGGVQSAAFTNWVLMLLNKATEGKFMHRVAAISSVSGGSVGVFHLAMNNYDPAIAYETSVKSTIDDVAWGWFVPDLTRAFVPWGRDLLIDRGWALEKSLTKNAYHTEKPIALKDEVFMDSPQLQPSGSRPALIINATVLEQGYPIVFTNTKMKSPEIPEGQKRACGPNSPPLPASSSKPSFDPYDFWELYHRKVLLVTAARLSATFPYVSPDSRTFQEAPACPDFHLADGGYYDNYGILSLTRWVEQGLPEAFLTDPAQAQKRKVVLIRILPFPEKQSQPGVEGWASQILAPLNGVLATRDTAQMFVSNAVEHLSRRPTLDVVQIEFRYKAPNKNCEKPVLSPPLNWVLTQEQKTCIELQTFADEVGKVKEQMRF